MSISIRPSSSAHRNVPIREMKYIALKSDSLRLMSSSGLRLDVEDIVTLVGNLISYLMKICFPRSSRNLVHPY